MGDRQPFDYASMPVPRDRLPRGVFDFLCLRPSVNVPGAAFALASGGWLTLIVKSWLASSGSLQWKWAIVLGLCSLLSGAMTLVSVRWWLKFFRYAKRVTATVAEVGPNSWGDNHPIRVTFTLPDDPHTCLRQWIYQDWARKLSQNDRVPLFVNSGRFGLTIAYIGDAGDRED